MGWAAVGREPRLSAELRGVGPRACRARACSTWKRRRSLPPRLCAGAFLRTLEPGSRRATRCREGHPGPCARRSLSEGIGRSCERWARRREANPRTKRGVAPIPRSVVPLVVPTDASELFADVPRRGRWGRRGRMGRIWRRCPPAGGRAVAGSNPVSPTERGPVRVGLSPLDSAARTLCAHPAWRFCHWRTPRVGNVRSLARAAAFSYGRVVQPLSEDREPRPRRARRREVRSGRRGNGGHEGSRCRRSCRGSRCRRRGDGGWVSAGRAHGSCPLGAS